VAVGENAVPAGSYRDIGQSGVRTECDDVVSAVGWRAVPAAVRAPTAALAAAPAPAMTRRLEVHMIQAWVKSGKVIAGRPSRT
jgi:hypothetical protein